MIINPTGGDKRLPKLTAPGSANDLLTGKQLLDANGELLVGTMPEAAQGVPSISVGAGGLITATVNQDAGHVAAGTRSKTHQLTVQAAQTITPGTANKTIAAGRYLTGVQTIRGDSNLVPGNIRSGVNIFGVTGNMATGQILYEGFQNLTSISSDCRLTVYLSQAPKQIAFLTLVAYSSSAANYANRIFFTVNGSGTPRFAVAYATSSGIRVIGGYALSSSISISGTAIVVSNGVSDWSSWVYPGASIDAHVGYIAA